MGICVSDIGSAAVRPFEEVSEESTNVCRKRMRERERGEGGGNVNGRSRDVAYLTYVSLSNRIHANVASLMYV